MENCSLKLVLNYISISADIITVVGVIVGIFTTIIKRNENLLAFKINNFLHYMLRIGMIMILLVLLFQLSKFVYTLLITFLTGAFETNNYYWRSGYEFQYTFSYLICLIIYLSLLWVISTVIWTSAFNYAIHFINLFIPKYKISLKQIKLLEIVKADYGTDKNNIDVTQILRQMSINNILKIKASNELAGDPHYGVVKRLKIIYKFDNKSNEIIINEGETVTIPEHRNNVL